MAGGNTKGALVGFLGVWLLFTLVLVFFIQARSYYGANPIFRARLEREGFQGGAGAGGSTGPPQPRAEEAGGGQQPAPAQLANGREPYSLLKGWLPAAGPAAASQGLSAQRCYASDFQQRLERTGNFRQMTNNYKRGDPNSCSAPIQDLVLPFYQVEPVPFVGCLKN